jgi:hypothetical protein
MIPKSWNTGVREALQRCTLLHNGLLKHTSVATNTHTTVQKLLEVVFLNASMSKPYKEGL